MPGREKPLLADLSKLYKGAKPSELESDWDALHGKHEWGPGWNPSSKNIYKLVRSVRLIIKTKWPSLYPKNLPDPVEETIQILSEEKKLGFMLNEQDSPIYWFLHLQLAGTVLWLNETWKMDDQLLRLANEWLSNFKTSCMLTATDGLVFLCGMRGWDDDPPSHDILECLLFNRAFPKFVHKYDYGAPITKMAPMIQRLWKSNTDFPIWPKMVPVHYIQYEHGELTFIEKSINGNTPARAVALRTKDKSLVGNAGAMYWESNCGWLPGKVARYRGRGKSDKAEVVFDGRALSYRADFYAPNGVAITLDGLGNILRHQVWNTNGLHEVKITAPENLITPPKNGDIYMPDIPPKKEHKSWIEKILEWLGL